MAGLPLRKRLNGHRRSDLCPKKLNTAQIANRIPHAIRSSKVVPAPPPIANTAAIVNKMHDARGNLRASPAAMVPSMAAVTPEPAPALKLSPSVTASVSLKTSPPTSKVALAKFARNECTNVTAEITSPTIRAAILIGHPNKPKTSFLTSALRR